MDDARTPSHVLVLGLGASGLALARWALRQGGRVQVVDSRESPPQLDALRALSADVRFESVSYDADWAATALQGVTEIWVSPGLSPATIEPLRQVAQAATIPVLGELGVFARALAELAAQRGHQPQVLAVTGTNGKTTVTALTGQLVERAGKRVAVAGNIGPSMLDTLAERLDADDLPEVWVLELSSFQLHDVTGFEPTAATVLNVSQDHLDWHGDMPAYVGDKSRVFGQRGLMVLNRDDAAVMALWPWSSDPKKKPQPLRAAVSFGLGLPTVVGDFGLETVNGMTWLVRAIGDEGVRRRRDEAEEIFLQRLMPADALRIRGRHNAANALAALALATAAGCALGPMLYGLREYRGEPHRVEPVAIVREVEYFDDSKGTNVGATLAALQGLGAERRLVLILGGVGKGQDFSPLADAVSRYARAVVLIGRDAPAIRAALEPSAVPLLDAVSMDDAVQQAAARAHSGDAVLMSPACASFDMFKDYVDRANAFHAAVAELAQDAGLALEALT